MSVGKVIQSGEGRFQWIIIDFCSTVDLNEEYETYESSPFNYLNVTYNLVMTVERDSKIGMYLKEHSTSISREVSVSLRIRSGPRRQMEIRCGEISDGHFFVDRWLTPKEMMKRRSEILDSYGNLTVFCHLSLQDVQSNTPVVPPLLATETIGTADNKDGCIENVECEFEEEGETVSQRKSRNKMIEDMKLLLADDEDCDVVLKVGDKEFRAHRIILRARSPVFKAMFSHDSAENQSGEVTISDCDPATFPAFLTYVYTGSSRHISAENVCSLYTAADKYCLGTLKEECSQFMMNNMSVDSFCDFLALALLHEEKELVELATGFVCVHTLAIMKTVKWRKFLKENIDVGNELFLKALKAWKGTIAPSETI